MSNILDPILRSEAAKKLYQKVGIRKPFVKQEKTNHYRMPMLEENGGWLLLNKYKGPEIPESQWMDLEYASYATDMNNLFAPIASADGQVKLEGFWLHGKTDKDGVWTANADKAPLIKQWVESVGANFGRIQLLRLNPLSMREAIFGLHLDDNNRLNPEGTGWVVRVWLELTDDPDSFMILRKDEFDSKNEVRLHMPKYTQMVVDSEFLFHSVYHPGPKPRYAVIASFESGPALEKWIKEQGVVDLRTQK